MKSFFSEFKTFALKGNVMALAVGIIIGGAFQGVVTSLTDNILSPVIGMFVGSNFDTLSFSVFGAVFFYGAFITSVINFFIIALVVFMIVKWTNKSMLAAKKDEPAANAAPARTCPYCKAEVHADATRCPACTSHLAI